MTHRSGMQDNFTKDREPGVVVWQQGNSSTLRYRRNPDGTVQWCGVNDSEWLTSAVESNPLHNPPKADILAAIHRFWPKSEPKPAPKVEPFGLWGWVPAGEGCVRATRPNLPFARYRRNGSVIEGQDRRTKTWRQAWAYEVVSALDHFWPQAPVALPDKVFTRKDGRRIKWLKGSCPNTVRMYWCDTEDPEGLFTWDRSEVNESRWPGLIEAIDFYWPQAPTNPVDEPIAWTFKVTPDKVDLDRILREAYAAGAREVTVDRDGVLTTYLHRSEYTFVALWSSARHWRVHEFGDWWVCRQPVLAEARARKVAHEAAERAKQPRKVVVKVSGVR